MGLFARRTWSALAVTLSALVLSVCGGGGKANPSAASAPAVPTPSPTPAAKPTPEPPVSASCARIGNGATTYKCDEESPAFLGDVTDAIASLQGERPDIFDPSNSNSVTNIGAYYVGLIKTLDRKGICANFDGEELAVKTSNDYNEQYKVLTARSLVNRKYLGTCTPAAFVAQAASPPSPAGCPLPPSQEIACGSPPSQYYSNVADAIDEVLKEKPELFDYTQKSPGSGWPRVTDWSGYYGAIFDILGKQGFCTFYDGDEIEVKRTDDFTEHFKISYADTYIRTGTGIYRAACYPAAF